MMTDQLKEQPTIVLSLLMLEPDDVNDEVTSPSTLSRRRGAMSFASSKELLSIDQLARPRFEVGWTF